MVVTDSVCNGRHSAGVEREASRCSRDELHQVPDAGSGQGDAQGALWVGGYVDGDREEHRDSERDDEGDGRGDVRGGWAAKSVGSAFGRVRVFSTFFRPTYFDGEDPLSLNL